MNANGRRVQLGQRLLALAANVVFLTLADVFVLLFAADVGKRATRLRRPLGFHNAGSRFRRDMGSKIF